jgi:Kef-type K+ transport system membrane component KefB
LAVGVSISVTALPVLAAILREMDLLHDRLGQFALGLAALNDAVLWILLAALLAGTVGTTSAPDLIRLAVAFLLYIAGMLGVVRPFLARILAHGEGDNLSDGKLMAALAIAISSAALTEAMGLHYIFGAFLAGAVMPATSRRAILGRLEPVTTMALMPFFFIVTGLKTTIDVGSAAFGQIFIFATAAAVGGKIAGTAVTARAVGESLPTALTLGALMQTKGLMEVVVLTVLLDARLITATVFSALVLMALVSTALAMPAARLIQGTFARSERRAKLRIGDAGSSD